MDNNPGSTTKSPSFFIPLLTLNRHDSDLITIVEEKVTKVGGDPVIRKYAKGRMLGKGGFAKCYEFTNLENKKVMAAKLIIKASLTKSRARQKVGNFLAN